jgi:hypothetical protein
VLNQEIYKGASQLKRFFYLISTSKYESHSQVLPENALEPYQQQEDQKKGKGYKLSTNPNCDK